jgi:hypothetical protein
MQMYDFDTTFKFGKYYGETLLSVAFNDPNYIVECLNNIPDFYLSLPGILKMESLICIEELSKVAKAKLKQMYLRIMEQVNCESTWLDRWGGWDMQELRADIQPFNMAALCWSPNSNPWVDVLVAGFKPSDDFCSRN